ncbi:MAG: spermidine/putrescine transport system substrate-binding protein [Solirubrobacteraceae bacterium]|nr:spermidine/putrescine transport system substrate-binding protein [Solirubrobacteraceae bacterium]
MTSRLDRRGFLSGAASLGGAAILAGCGSSGGSGNGGATSAARPPIGQEPGKLSIYEWQGYEAAGTKAQEAYGMTVPGKSYVDKFGADSLTYTAFPSDDVAVNKVAAGTQFDLMHPCIGYVHDWVNAGLVEPFDTSLLTNWSQLDPNVTKAGAVDGKQYWVPWDSGYSSILYRKDKVDPADATGWELFWNPKYKGKISMWDGGSTPVEIAGLLTGAKDIYNMTDAELEAAKQKLIEQKPLNSSYWKLEYDDMQPAFKSGEVWITYAWPNDFNDMLVAGLDAGWLNPSQGQLAWYCGFVMGKGTQNYHHAHEYVDSFMSKEAAIDLANTFVYASANLQVTKADLNVAGAGNKDAYAQPAAVDVLNFGDPNRVAPPVHLEHFIAQRGKYQQVWEDVKAS